MAVTLARVNLWGTCIGVVTWDKALEVADFQYTQDLLAIGIELSPIKMPLQRGVYRFSALNSETFKGLPGLLADVLPDKYGNALIEQWLIRNHRANEPFNPVERLCYMANRSMGALEFLPSQNFLGNSASKSIQIDRMVELANRVLKAKHYHIQIAEGMDSDAMHQILQVGTSAGGARAKAIINWNPLTNDIRPGHEKPEPGYEAWLIKFDGVSENRDKELADPLGFGRIEYAYHLLAVAVGVEMMGCRLLEEGGRAHFMTRRFDRVGPAKVHVTSLCGIAHYDFNEPGLTSYEQAFQVCRDLKLPHSEVEQLYLRMVFNVLYRNQDDHTKNISFMMDRGGVWALTPAYDVTYSYNPKGDWTSQHQMTVNGKRDNFTLQDLHEAGQAAGLSKRRSSKVIKQVFAGLEEWPKLSAQAGVDEAVAAAMSGQFRDEILAGND